MNSRCENVKAAPAGRLSESSASLGLSAARPGLGRIFGAVALTTVGTNLLFVGIFFFTKWQFNWTLQKNFLLAGGQGVLYIIGALSAEPLTRRFDRRAGLIVLSALMALATAVAAAFPSAGVVTGVVLVFTFVSAVAWPMFESLISEGADPHNLSRRIGLYNLTWSGVGVGAIAIEGTLMKVWPPLVFALPAVVHILAVVCLFSDRRRRPVLAAPETSDHPQPEAALLAKRSLALWVSRIALPATFCVIYSLGAIMPLLPVVQALPKDEQTALASVWMIGRLAAFAMLVATIWWHTRPRLLLGASVVMLIAFLGICTQWSSLAPYIGLPRASLRADIIWICAWQLALGLVMGLIYQASLYFGMVLSEGSTEHGGYHEALIGLGQVMGPGLGVATQHFWPGSLFKGVAAISSLLAASILLALIAGFKQSHRRT